MRPRGEGCSGHSTCGDERAEGGKGRGGGGREGGKGVVERGIKATVVVPETEYNV